MKNLLTIFFLFVCYAIQGQEYRCFQPGQVNFFLNGNGYLRGIRIDSVRSSGIDTLYYPYRTPRGKYGCYGTSLDSAGGSWLGKKVVCRSNGEYLFDNIWNDTVVIKTHAHLGDTWSFFNDPSHISYRAAVTAMDTLSIFGVLDSIKRITINADSGGIANPLDPVDNFEIVLSKNHGFVQVFDLYTFPYHLPDSIRINRDFFDYYLDLVTDNLHTADITCFKYHTNPPDTNNSIFKLTKFYNPTLKEIYDFEVGDVFESFDYRFLGSHGYHSELILDSISGKTITATNVSYSVIERRKVTDFVVSGISITTTVTDHREVTSWGGDTSRLINFGKLPEEWRSYFFVHYGPSAPSVFEPAPVCPTATYLIDRDNIDYDFCSVVLQPTDFNSMVGFGNQSYGIGFGNSATHDHQYTLGTYRDKNYIFVKKGVTTCGTFTPVPVGIDEVQHSDANFQVYPNPAFGQLNINSNGDPLTEVVIYDIVGRVLLQKETKNEKNVTLNISGLSSGMYVVRINGLSVQRFVKE